MKKTAPSRADNVGWFLIKVARPDLAPQVAAQVDALFQNSLAETLTETEQAFAQGFVSMTEAILLAIQVVSWVVIGVILMVLANTMAMSARERQGEYAVLKTMGFKARHLVGLILGESLILALAGGLVGEALTFPAVHFFKANLGQYFRVFPLTRDTLVLGLAVALAVGLLAGSSCRPGGPPGSNRRGAAERWGKSFHEIEGFNRGRQALTDYCRGPVKTWFFPKYRAILLPTFRGVNPGQSPSGRIHEEKLIRLMRRTLCQGIC